MHHYYHDIIGKLGEPQWWDEYAVPRYCEFKPQASANIYTHEVALVLIECQGCGREFQVSFSGRDFDFGPNGLEDGRGKLREAAKDGSLHYGDPPNAGCCAAGPTMNSIPLQVLEFWTMDRDRNGREWERRPEFEVAIDPKRRVGA